MHCPDAVFTNVYLLGRDIAICFKEILKDRNVNLIKEQIKLQCLCSVELKNASRTSKIKTKHGKILHLNVDS